MTDHHALSAVRDVWRDLLLGRLKVAGTADAAGYGLLLERITQPVASPARAQRQLYFEAALRGTPQKVISAESGLAPATLATLLQRALAELGLEPPFSRLPVALPLLAHAARGANVLALCEVSEPDSEDGTLLVTLCPPLQTLSGAVTPSECDVASRYIAGQTHVQIAEGRRASPRTIANQLGACFRALHASRRFELIRALLERAEAQGLPLKVTVRAVREDRPARCPVVDSAPPSGQLLSQPWATTRRTAHATTHARS